MNVVYMITFIVGVISVLIYYEKTSNDVVYVQSQYDGHKYLVKNAPDKQNAADLIAKIRENLNTFVTYMSCKYSDRSMVKRLSEKFNGDNLMENAGNKYTSYSVNKGEKIVLCLRSRDQLQTLESYNVLIFVSLHELAHLATKSVGHTDEFWHNFKFN